MALPRKPILSPRKRLHAVRWRHCKWRPLVDSVSISRAGSGWESGQAYHIFKRPAARYRRRQTRACLSPPCRPAANGWFNRSAVRSTSPTTPAPTAMHIALRLRQLSARSLFSVENASAALWASPPERLAYPHDDDRGAGPSLHALRRCRGFAAEASPVSQDDEEEQREIGNPRVRPPPQGGKWTFIPSVLCAAVPHPSAILHLLSAAPGNLLQACYCMDHRQDMHMLLVAFVIMNMLAMPHAGHPSTSQNTCMARLLVLRINT